MAKVVQVNQAPRSWGTFWRRLDKWAEPWIRMALERMGWRLIEAGPPVWKAIRNDGESSWPWRGSAGGLTPAELLKNAEDEERFIQAGLDEEDEEDWA